MANPNRLVIAFKSLFQLGVKPVVLNALYRFGLATGHYQRVTGKHATGGGWHLKAVLPIPKQEELLAILGGDGQKKLLAEADEIVVGKAHLFGGDAVPLRLSIPGKLADWTAYETGRASIPYSLFTDLPANDIKFIWEPARFGWVFTLGRAYLASKENKYSEAFWRYFETFSDANPPCLGPHWMSGQEVALRLMSFVWAAQIFESAPASTAERKIRVTASVVAHAERIPPTLVYARSQQNNHLLIEAAGLLTAGFALPDHPQSAQWSRLGWKWLNAGLRSQIDGYGEYTQHSTNYHRLMLQVALWANTLIHNTNTPEPERVHSSRWSRQTIDAIGRASHWLLALLDFDSGRTPNLGANDGAYIFPLTICPFDDYRPVLHSVARAFLNYDLPRGPWDEMSLWFGIPFESKKYIQLPRYLGDQIYGKDSWAFLRTAQFRSRPSHADQLHLDLWWRGHNIARDAGTYLYNVAPPWDNRLTTSRVHNTVTLNGRDQFTRAGRFLYLDWFDAYRKTTIETGTNILQSFSAHYHAYRRPGIRHTRTVTAYADERWIIQDEMLVKPWFIMPDGHRSPRERSLRKGSVLHAPRLPAALPLYRLQWLLPDWDWEFVPLPEEMRAAGCDLRVKSPYGWLIVRISTDLYAAKKYADTYKIGLVRAGETLYGDVEPIAVDGWFSPTYGVKVPALSLSMTLAMPGCGSFTTEFIFPK